MMQTIYKLQAWHPKRTNEPPIESLHTDYHVVTRMQHNMILNGWLARVQWVQADWKTLRDE